MGRDREDAKLERCVAHGLTYDPSVHGGCVLCRAPSSALTPRRKAWRLVGALLVLALGSIGGWQVLSRRAATRGEGVADANDRAHVGTLRVTNAAGRSGAYFLPAGFESAPRPLLVLFHGSGGDGQRMVRHFSAIAAERKVLLLAPDSRRSPDGVLTWQVGDSGELTPDFEHTRAALAEFLALPGVRIDPARVLAAGYSGGGSSAPYVATRDPRFRGFAVLHGGVFPGGLGTNRVPAWFSTGDDDAVRTPAAVRRAAESVGSKASSLHFRTFPGPHALIGAELEALFDWWLGPPPT
jgi:predicted esterase